MAGDRVSRPPTRIWAATGLLDQRLDTPRISIGLVDVADSDQGLLHIAQRIDHAAALTRLVACPYHRIKQRHRLLQVAERSVLDRDKLLNAPQLPVFDRALADRERLQSVGECFLVVSEQRPGIAAVVVELRNFGSTRIFRRQGVGLGLARGDLRSVRLFAVENRGDVGDGTRRRDKDRLDGGEVLRRYRRIVVRRRWRRHAGRLLLLFTHHARAHDRRTALFPGFLKSVRRREFWFSDFADHAFVLLRLHELPALLLDLLVGGGNGGLDQNNRSERAGTQHNRQAAPWVHAFGHVGPRKPFWSCRANFRGGYGH